MKRTYFLAVGATIASAVPSNRHQSSDGCGNHYSTGWSNDTSKHSLPSGGYTRTYGVNIPDDYNKDDSKRWPVIIDYHGAMGTSYSQYMNSLYFNYTQGQEYLAIYPQGVGGFWQGPNYSDPHVNDLQFTSDLLDEINSKYCIDTDRIYASGKSNGAGFVDTLACSDHGDDFAAFAMASAALYTDLNEAGCTKKRALLESHGSLDTTVPYAPTTDGSGGPLPDIGAWVGWWGTRNCGTWSLPVNSGNLGGYTTTTYSCGPYRNLTTHYEVNNLGHCWPTAFNLNTDATRNTSDLQDCHDTALDFTPIVLDFFAQWNLNNAPKSKVWAWPGIRWNSWW